MNGAARFIGQVVLIVLLFSLLFSYAMFQGGFVSWFLFFSFLPIFIYHVGLLVYPLKKWQLGRIVSRHIIRSGDSIDVTVKVKRTFPFPLFYCICEEMIPETLGKNVNRQGQFHHLHLTSIQKAESRMKSIVFPWFRRTIEFSYTMKNMPRGEHQLHAIRIKTGDVFGFINREHIFYVEDQIIALPKKYPVHLKNRINSFEQGSQVSHQTNIKSAAIVTGVREYSPGDKVSWIDWKQTARKNTVMTKEFEQEKSTDAMIVMDSCDHEGMRDATFEAIVEVSFSLVEAIGKEAAKLSFVSIGKETLYIALNQDRQGTDQIRRHLTRVQQAETYPFSMKLGNESAKIAHAQLVVIVTGYVDAALREAMKQLGKRSKRVIVAYITLAEHLSRDENRIMEDLAFAGIVVNVLPVKDLARKRIEVNI